MIKAGEIPLYLIVYAVSVTFFILKTYGVSALFGATMAFAVMAAVSLLAALYSSADEPYYGSLTRSGLLTTLGAFAGMIAVSSFFVGVVGRSVLWYPTAFNSLPSFGEASSVFTALLGELVYQLAVVASGEELLKFAAYTELRRRYGSVALAAGVSVGLWAGFHALQAYHELLYVIPAFVCGLVLLALLEYTHSIIAPIIAHGLYNTVCFAVSYQPPIEVPWFPTALTGGDILLVGLASLWIALILLPTLLRR